MNLITQKPIRGFQIQKSHGFLKSWETIHKRQKSINSESYKDVEHQGTEPEYQQGSEWVGKIIEWNKRNLRFRMHAYEIVSRKDKYDKI